MQAQTYLGVYYTEDDNNQLDFQQAASFFRAAASQNVSLPLTKHLLFQVLYCSKIVRLFHAVSGF